MGKGEPNLKMCLAESNLIQQNRQTITGKTDCTGSKASLSYTSFNWNPEHQHIRSQWPHCLMKGAGQFSIFLWHFGYLTFNVRIIVLHNSYFRAGFTSVQRGGSCSRTVHCRGVPVTVFIFGRACCVDTIVMRVITEQVGVTCSSFPVWLLPMFVCLY